MWSISNSTGFPAHGSWVQDKDLNKIWLVAVKATFDILPDGRTRPSDDQLPVFMQGQYLDGDFEKSLVYEFDFFGVKQGTDVLVNAAAHAPGGRPVTALDVGFQLGPITKRLKVFGDRFWTVSLVGGRDVISDPAPFVSQPIGYENAFGGWDRTASDPKDHRLEARNPVGRGFVSNPHGRLGRPLPNVEDPADLVGGWQSRPNPAGFGAIACHWSPRREFAGTYDDAWLKTRFPMWAIDLDPRYYASAPLDQQVKGFLRGGEPARAINLSPHGPIQFHLPKLVFGFATRKRRDVIHTRGQLATVILEPEVPRVIMVWQSSLVCNHDMDDLDQTLVILKKLI